jgi:hypothetical protein
MMDDNPKRRLGAWVRHGRDAAACRGVGGRQVGRRALYKFTEMNYSMVDYSGL